MRQRLCLVLLLAVLLCAAFAQDPTDQFDKVDLAERKKQVAEAAALTFWHGQRSSPWLVHG
jgi:hypothetical protein